MIAPSADVSQRASELRQAFDRSFAETQHFVPIETEDFLAIHVGGDPHMLRLLDVAGLYSDKKVTSLPSSVAALRGIAGFRGTMLPVYDLAALLRYPRAEAPRWLAIAAEAPIALAFDAFDEHFRFPRAAIASTAGSDSREHVRQIVRADHWVRPIVHLPSIIAAIRTHIPDATSKKEQ